MHISLRTVFVIITAVAVFMGIHVPLLRDAGPMAASRWFYAAIQLPIVVVWVVGAVWAFQRRGTLTGAHLVLWALGLNFGGRLATDALQVWGYHENSAASNLGPLLFALSMFIWVISTTASWTLVLLALARANRGGEVKSAGGPTAVEEATNPWGEAERR